MRNRIKKSIVTISPEKQIEALSNKLDLALQEIKSLEAMIAFNAGPDTTPWIFDIERDIHGRMRGVTAQRDGIRELLM